MFLSFCYEFVILAMLEFVLPNIGYKINMSIPSTKWVEFSFWWFDFEKQKKISSHDIVIKHVL